MKSILFIVLMGVSLFGIGQETKKIKRKISSSEKEVFYVLKKNETIKNGKYELYTNKKLKLSGYYTNNLKDSVWTKYTLNGNKIWEGKYKNGAKNGIWSTYSYSGKIKTKGRYKNSERIGIWKFYNNKGELAQKFNFENKKIVYNDTTKTKSMFPIQGGIYNGLIYIDSVPKYKSGIKDLFRFLAQHLRYPSKAIEENISGTVYLSILVNKDGELSDFKVNRGIGGGCNEEAIRVLKMTNKKWKPASFNGVSVTTRMVLPIHFRLE